MQPALSNTTRTETVFHVACFGLFFMMIIAGFDGQVRVDGDDIVHTRADSVWERMEPPRYLLQFTYYGYKNWIFGSFSNAMIFNWALYLTSGIFLYFTLRRFFPALPSFLGGLFYLVHLSKYEILVWYSASFYVPVSISIMATIFILSTDRSFLTRGAWITVIGWISMLSYEIFASIAPAYLLFMLAEDYAKNRRFSINALVGGALPTIAVLAQIIIVRITLGSGAFVRHSDPAYDSTPILQKIFWGAFNTIEATIGAEHFEDLLKGLKGVPHQVGQLPILVPLAVLGATALWAALRRDMRRLTSAPGSSGDFPAQKRIAMFGLYCLVIAGVPSFIGSIHDAPSRLTTASSIGVAILISALAASSRRKVDRFLSQRPHPSTGGSPLQRHRWIMISIGLLILAQWAALTAIVNQDWESTRRDRAITEQIAAIYPIANDSDSFFAIVTRLPKRRKYLLSSRYESGGGVPWLWQAYDKDVNSLRYRSGVRETDGTLWASTQAEIELWIAQGVPAELVPFDIDETGKVRAIAAIRVLEPSGDLYAELTFPTHAQIPPQHRIELTYVRTQDGYREAD